MSFVRILAFSVLGVLAGVAYVAQLVRWLRVLQREHYLFGSTTRFASRWLEVDVQRVAPRPTGNRALRVVLLIVTLATVVLLARFHYDAIAVVAAFNFGVLYPRRLTVRGRTGALEWTRRATTVAVVGFAVSLVFGSAVATWRPWLGVFVVVVTVPLALDIAAWLCAPYETWRANKFVSDARRRLARVRPQVVAITGSYGKTSTKHHLAELLGSRHGVVPSPRSYNNRAGLSRAINENLSDDTKIFIAEMGTYGPGEIGALCEWCTPEIAIVTSIGPVHLERMGTLEVIEAAKFEITQLAHTVVLNVDDPRLAAWVPRLQSAGKKVLTAAAQSPLAEVRVTAEGERWRVRVKEQSVGVVPPVTGVHESNLACAVAAALELGVTIDEIVGRLSHLTVVSNRMVVATAPSGVIVIDDTFNANPAGAVSALATLATLPVNGRRVVVTPGIVEMGALQHDANQQLGYAVKDLGAELVVVGRTNRQALIEGYGHQATQLANREASVEWVRAQLHHGDAVLYLNDLPDHYP